MGVKLDYAVRERIKQAARQLDRTPHWLIKQAIFHYLDALEQGATFALPPPAAQAEMDNTPRDVGERRQP
ncbi:hypothetical protein BG74_08765, partial [Sodalis-like endosymbiont of Proechinophthirus fluctus]